MHPIERLLAGAESLVIGVSGGEVGMSLGKDPVHGKALAAGNHRA